MVERETRPGLDCFMICDNLRVHINSEIISNASSKGIHIFPIMPGYSHWFQVHDQFPFATLKNKMSEKKKRYFCHRRYYTPAKNDDACLNILRSRVLCIATPHHSRILQGRGIVPLEPRSYLPIVQGTFAPRSADRGGLHE